MGNDHLCIICGISPSAGPLWLIFASRLDEVSQDIASELTSANVGKEYDEILNIVHEALSSTLSDDERQLGYVPEWKPPGVADWFAFRRCVAIGHFDGEFGGAPTRSQQDGDGSFSKVPNGKSVEVRLVDGYRSDWFEHKLTGLLEEEPDEDEDGDGDAVEIEEEVISRITAYDGHPNFFTSEGCFHYLQAWLDLDGPAAAPLTFGGEFYEVVNSRREPRDWSTGTLPSIDYDGITATCVQTQDEFYLARKGVKHIARGIRDGLRGTQLIPAILRDCRVWMFMRPDTWPIPSDFPSLPNFTSCPLTNPSPTPFSSLPTELLLQIHTSLPFPSCISLWSTCKSLRTLLTDSEFVGKVLRDAIESKSGHLRWILPVETMPREVVPTDGDPCWKLPRDGDTMTEYERANAAIAQWYKCKGEESPVPKLLLPEFPLLEFVSACFRSDSMRNRERIWRNVKQVEVLWRDYRLNGWEVDRFYEP